jgi:hypothetical protein
MHRRPLEIRAPLMRAKNSFFSFIVE